MAETEVGGVSESLHVEMKDYSLSARLEIVIAGLHDDDAREELVSIMQGVVKLEGRDDFPGKFWTDWLEARQVKRG